MTSLPLTQSFRALVRFRKSNTYILESGTLGVLTSGVFHFRLICMKSFLFTLGVSAFATGMGLKYGWIPCAGVVGAYLFGYCEALFWRR